MRAWIAILALAAGMGAVVGSMMVYIAIQHNPQGEFIDHVTGAVNYGGLSAIFLSWLVVVGVTAGFPVALVIWSLVVCIGRSD